MEAAAKLITAVGFLLGALAWPSVFAAAIWVFRKEIRDALAKMPAVIDRLKAIKLGAIETQLEKVSALSSTDPETEGGQVGIAEIRAAAQIEADASSMGPIALLPKLEKLCIEYDTIRRIMPPGAKRTRGMTEIVVRMRSLGPALLSQISVFKSSASPGHRLAAIAMMQMEPDEADLEWLTHRFREERPFVFYHAALALQNVANSGDPEQIAAVKQAAKTALTIVRAFPEEPDAGSIRVLEAVLADEFSGHYS